MSDTSKNTDKKSTLYLPQTDEEKAEAFRLLDELLSELAKEARSARTLVRELDESEEVSEGAGSEVAAAVTGNLPGTAPGGEGLLRSAAAQREADRFKAAFEKLGVNWAAQEGPLKGMPDTTPSSPPIWTLTQAGYLQNLVALAERKFGASAPATLALRKELEEAQKEQGKPPPKVQRYWAGFRA